MGDYIEKFTKMMWKIQLPPIRIREKTATEILLEKQLSIEQLELAKKILEHDLKVPNPAWVDAPYEVDYAFFNSFNVGPPPKVEEKPLPTFPIQFTPESIEDTNGNEL